MNAAQIGGQFIVTASLQSGHGAGGGGAGQNANFCHTVVADAFGAHATVVCSTGTLVDISPGKSANRFAPIHGGANRFVTQIHWNGEWLEELDDSPGMGTITSWRMVDLTNRRYLELTVGW